MTKKLYNVVLSEKQLLVLAEAADLMQRVQLGQWREIQDSLPLQKPIDYEMLHSHMDIIGKILSHHMIDGIDGFVCSLGIGSSDLPKSNSILYDLRTTIEHKLSWERAVEEGIVENENSPRKWSEMMTVNFDPPMKWSDEPLPKITRIN
jgi:uncharacterized glyoxalase superfamily protein PhnB